MGLVGKSVYSWQPRHRHPHLHFVCWDIKQRDNDLLVKELRRGGTRAYGFTIDISDRSALEPTAAKVRREVGVVSVVINNAGILPCHQFLAHNPREIRRLFQVNLFSHFWILREFLPSMIQRRKGHVVAVSSAAALGGARNLVPYAASKSAIGGYMESLRAELDAHPDKPDIKLMTVHPAYTSNFRHVKIHSRYPGLIPVLEPDIFARKRMDYKGIKKPSSFQLLSALYKLSLRKQRSLYIVGRPIN